MRQAIFLLMMLFRGTNFIYGQTGCTEILNTNMDLLPKYYREKAMDSLSQAVADWEKLCNGGKEVRITRLLLNIEEGGFAKNTHPDSALLVLLNGYADHFPPLSGCKCTPENPFYKFSIAWSTILLKNKILGSDEEFICKVLSGEIRNPLREVEKNLDKYPGFAEALGQVYKDYRKRPRTNLAVSTGLWRPTQNLSLLGIHPSAGLQVGLRKYRQELNLTMQFRFNKSANDYIVQKDGYVITSDSYFGGYIGLDYNYYLVSKPGFEFGLLAGMGYDGFDVDEPVDANASADDSFKEIWSLNGNIGLRFNLYTSQNRYIAIQWRYNVINYANPGGTDFSGDAFSIDLLFGIQSRHPLK